MSAAQFPVLPALSQLQARLSDDPDTDDLAPEDLKLLERCLTEAEDPGIVIRALEILGSLASHAGRSTETETVFRPLLTPVIQLLRTHPDRDVKRQSLRMCGIVG